MSRASLVEKEILGRTFCKGLKVYGIFRKEGFLGRKGFMDFGNGLLGF